MASRESIIPSPLPPLVGRSYTASAAKPFGLLEGACGVKLPNSCLPLSTRPSASGRARNALSAPWAVHPIWIGVPVPEISNRTPNAALVRKNPFPLTSTIMGELQPVWPGGASSPGPELDPPWQGPLEPPPHCVQESLGAGWTAQKAHTITIVNAIRLNLIAFITDSRANKKVLSVDNGNFSARIVAISRSPGLMLTILAFGVVERRSKKLTAAILSSVFSLDLKGRSFRIVRRYNKH